MLCVLLVEGMSVAHGCEVMYFGCYGFSGELGFLNCDDVLSATPLHRRMVEGSNNRFYAHRPMVSPI